MRLGHMQVLAELKSEGLNLTVKGYTAVMDAYANMGEPYK
jgi:hypothetical protein